MKKRLIPLMVLSVLSFSLVSTTLTGCGEVGEGPKGDKGETGDPGHTPVVEIKDGYWHIDGENTNIPATGENGQNGEDGHTPIVTIGKDGYWYIDGKKTDIKATGENGQDGQDGEDGEKGDTAYSNTILPSIGGYVKPDKGSYLVGDTVNFEVIPYEGFIPVGIIINEKENALNSVNTFKTTMVEGGLVVQGIFEYGEIIGSEDITPSNPNISFGDLDSTETTTIILDNVDLGSKEVPFETINFKGNKGTTIFKGTVDENGDPTSTLYLKGATYSGNDIILENINIVIDNKDEVKATTTKGLVPSENKAVNSITLNNINMDVLSDIRDPFVLDANTINVNDVNVNIDKDVEAYHIFETNYASKAQIKKATFSNVNVNSCAQNVISLYNFTDDAEVIIENSTFGSETSTVSQVIRFTNQNSKAKENNGEGVNVKLTVKDTKYHAEKADEYTGFAIFQDSQTPYVGNYSDFTFEFTNVKSYQNDNWTTLAEGNIDYNNQLQSRPYYIYLNEPGTTEVTDHTKLPSLTIDEKVIDNESLLKNYANVTITQPKHATLSVNYDKFIKEGTEVTVTAEAEEFYEIKEIKVNGEVITNGKFTIDDKTKNYEVTATTTLITTKFKPLIDASEDELKRVCVQATVVAKKGDSGNVLFDGYDFITTHTYDKNQIYEVNDVVRIKGKPSKFFGYTQFNFAANDGDKKTIGKIEGGIPFPQEPNTPITYTNELANKHKDALEKDIEKFVSFEAVALKDNKFRLDGGSVDIKIQNPVENFIEGKKYRIEGVLDSYHTGIEAIQLYQTSYELIYEKVSDITISETDITLDKGVSKDVTIKVTPDDALQEWDYKVNEGGNEIITVTKTDNGLNINAVAPGTTSITITSTGKGTNGQPITKTFNVTVNDEVPQLESIEIKASKTTIEVGEELNIETILNPNIEGLEITYSTNNQEVAKFNDLLKPTLIGVSEGVVKVIAKCGDITSNEIEISVVSKPEIGAPASSVFKEKWSGTQMTIDDLTWSIKTTGNGSFQNFDKTRGTQFGSSKNPYNSIEFTTNSYLENIKTITINTCGASGTDAKVQVLVNGTNLLYNMSKEVNLTTISTDYKFELATPLNGEITIKYTLSAKALYVKSFGINI